MNKEKLLEIVKYYGIEKQLKYIHTEYFELDEACLSGNKEHIAEELADVYVMLNQIRVYFEIDNEKITQIADFKIERQLERIENERKEKNE